jgi:hypothetical protein
MIPKEAFRMNFPRYRVLAYRRTGNLGDALQAYAIARLLPGQLTGVFRDALRSSETDGSRFVVNGWLGDDTPEAQDCCFAGVFLGRKVERQLAWIRQSTFPIGARDGHTQRLLASNGLRSKLVGCATLTLPRFTGPRESIVNVDAGDLPGQKVTNFIPDDLGWQSQWSLAAARLRQLRTAKLVYTTRLHIVLPCLAFGTPVIVPINSIRRIPQNERFSLLDMLNFEYGVPNVIDITSVAQRFRDFLSDSLSIPIADHDPPTLPLCVETGAKPKQVLIGILSCRHNVARQNLCRCTWLRDVPGSESVEVVFIVGDTTISQPERHEDMLFVPCADDYNSLPDKMRHFLSWACNETPFDYIFKCDDDTYVCLPRLLAMNIHDADYIGRPYSGYAQGGAGYWLSRRSATIAAEALKDSPNGWEDQLIGRALSKAGIRLRPETRFCCESNSCHNPSLTNAIITCHHCSGPRMIDIHGGFVNSLITLL